MDIDTILNNAVSQDGNLRKEAENQLLQAEAMNFPALVLTLTAELAREERNPVSRRLAGVILKNSLDHKDQNKSMRWRNIDPTLRAQIKNQIFVSLVSNVRDARQQASQVISKIALIELPHNEWADLIPTIVQNMNNAAVPPTYIESTLDILGFICEEIEPDTLKDQSNLILTAVVNGLVKDASWDIKIAAATALLNALEFARRNFENENERNVIIQVIGAATQSSEARLRELAFQCLVKIAGLYYDKLIAYMPALYQVTLKAIKEETGGVALQAIEFWSTICEEEIAILEEMDDSEEQPRIFRIIQGALDGLVPVLTQTLTKQEEDDDEDTWNESMAACTCLSYVATAVGDLVLPKTLEFIKPNLENPDWHFKEAAVVALGAILVGTKSREIEHYLSSIMNLLFKHIQDPNVHVRDTTAWCLGRICQFHPDVMKVNLQGFVSVLGVALADVPRVSGNCAYALHEIAKSFDSDEPPASSQLSSFFQPAIQALLSTTERPDADEHNLRSSAYEAVNAFVLSAPNDCLKYMGHLIQFFLEKLQKTFLAQAVSQEDREEINDQRALLCGSLYNIIQRLGSEIKPFAEPIMASYLQVLSIKSASVHEETLMGVGALANAIEGEFDKFVHHFVPFLLNGLRNWQEYEVCSIAVGVVGDIARSIQIKIAPYTDQIIQVLLEDLKNPELNRNVKPPILSSFGDIALALSGNFEKYLPVVVVVLQHASSTQLTDKEDEDLVDYINVLRESIFEAYTGILQGLKTDNKGQLMIEYVKHIIDFAEITLHDDISTHSVIRGALGVFGDIAVTVPSVVPSLLFKETIRGLISKHLKTSDDTGTQKVASWALQQINSANRA